MVILGLTGSIGMGKSTAARMFRVLGVPVYDSDAAVHRLLARGGAAVGPVEAIFPGVVDDGRVDRQRLAARVFGDPEALERLERILHPKVRWATLEFLKQQARARRPIVVLDIPLLFETGGEQLCDAVVVVSAPASVQVSRVLYRAGMTRERFEAIAAKQMSDKEKRRRADFVVWTGGSKRDTLRRISALLKTMRRRAGRHWPPRRRLPYQPPGHVSTTGKSHA
jgi:dephospho-CoA kinase